MPAEYEAKVLDIDAVKVTELIQARGGRRVRDTVLLRRNVYDIVAGDDTRWIRLRSTGSQATLTVKEIIHDGIDGTHEVEVGVDDFEAANDLLGRLGFTPKSYQENRRTSFELQDARLEIDEWPLIPPYLEIEADSRDEVIRVADLLGYVEADLTAENTVKVYRRYGIDLLAHTRLSFDDR
jgi:adenylate cyclase class 2